MCNIKAEKSSNQDKSMDYKGYAQKGKRGGTLKLYRSLNALWNNLFHDTVNEKKKYIHFIPIHTSSKFFTQLNTTVGDMAYLLSSHDSQLSGHMNSRISNNEQKSKSLPRSIVQFTCESVYQMYTAHFTIDQHYQ